MTFTRSTPSPTSETVIMTTRCFSSGTSSTNISRCSLLLFVGIPAARTSGPRAAIGRLVVEVIGRRSEGRRYFYGSVELRILRRVVSLGHMNIRFDASAFNQPSRWRIPGPGRNSHKEIVPDRFRVTTDHLAGGPGAHDWRQMFIGGERGNTLASARGRLIDQKYRSAVKRVCTEALRCNPDRRIRETVLHRQPRQAQLPTGNPAKCLERIHRRAFGSLSGHAVSDSSAIRSEIAGETQECEATTLVPPKIHNQSPAFGQAVNGLGHLIGDFDADRPWELRHFEPAGVMVELRIQNVAAL